jgi:transglutaminase-like putative cysteine protease
MVGRFQENQCVNMLRPQFHVEPALSCFEASSSSAAPLQLKVAHSRFAVHSAGKSMTPLTIHHRTQYLYSGPVELGEHRLLIRPRSGHDVRIVSSDLVITPSPAKLTWARDVYGNSVAHVYFASGVTTTELDIVSDVRIEHYDDKPLDFLVDSRAVKFPFLLLPSERIELWPYLIPSYLDDQDAVAVWAQQYWQAERRVETYAMLDRMNRAIAQEFTYRAREEPGVQRPGTTLSSRSGSCRDFATLMIEACRHLGLPARFVIGYASTEEIPAAMGATHAWAEVFLPGAGWKGFDSTGGIVTGPKHIAVAVGRDPESLPPVAGSFSIVGQPVTASMKVTVNVTRSAD